MANLRSQFGESGRQLIGAQELFCIVILYRDIYTYRIFITNFVTESVTKFRIENIYLGPN